MPRPNRPWNDPLVSILTAGFLLIAVSLPAVGGTSRVATLSPEELRRIPAANDGLRLLTQLAALSESFISPRECLTCSGDGVQDATDISYSVVSSDTIRVGVSIEDAVTHVYTGDIERIGKKAPGTDQLIPGFDAILDGVQTDYVIPDGSYLVIIRAIDDTGRVEVDTLSLAIDRLPPVVISATVRGGITTYRNNETIIIDLVTDGPNYEFTLNFGAIDSNPTGGTEIFDHGGGSYEIRHTISVDNTRPDAADLIVPIIVDDQAGNRTRYNALRFCLSNDPPRLVSIATPDNPDGSYRNGDRIIVESTWDSPDTILSVTIDFSPLDSSYDSTMLTTARLAGNVYRATYVMSETNTFPDGEYLVPLVAEDRGCGSSAVTTVRIRIDTEAGSRPILDALPAAVRSPTLVVSGMAPGSSNVDIRRNLTAVITVPVAEDGRFEATITLLPGTNTIAAIARDNAGNQTELSSTVSVVYVTDMFIKIPAPFRPGGTIQVGTDKTADRLRIEFWTLGGDLANVFTDETQRDIYTLTWDGTDGSGNRLNSGPLIAVFILDYADGTSHVEKQAMILAPPVSQ